MSSTQPARDDMALEGNTLSTGPDKPATSAAAALPSPASSPRSSATPDVLTSNGELLAALGTVIAKDAPELAPGGEALTRLGGLLSNTGDLQSHVREELASGAARQPDGAISLSADTAERIREILASTAEGTDLAAAQRSADAVAQLASVLNGVERLERDVRSEVNATQIPRAGPSADADALAQGGDLLTRLGAVLAKDAPVLAPGADALSRMGSAVNSTANLERDIRSELGIGNIQIPPRIELDAEDVSRAAQHAANPDMLSRGGETLSRLSEIAAQDAPILSHGADVLGRLGATLSGAGKLGSDVREVVGTQAGDPLHIGHALAHLGSLLSGAVKHNAEPVPRTQTSPTPALAPISEQSTPQDYLRSDRMLNGARAPRPTRISLPPSVNDRDLPALPTPARTTPGGSRRRPYSGIDIPGSDEFARAPMRALTPGDTVSSIRRQDSGSRRPTTSEGEHFMGAQATGVAQEQPAQDPFAHTVPAREINERNGQHSRAGSTSAGRSRSGPAFGAGGGGGGGGGPNHYSDVDRHHNEKRESRLMKTISERLEPTLIEAEKQKAKAAGKARRLGWALNTAIGIQVVFGALTTGLGAALHGGGSSIAISILGGGSTIVATYLAKVRGSDEPELSRIRVAALDHFIRELKAFNLDHGSETGHEWDHELSRYRTDLEALLGQNSSDGQNGGGNAKDMQIWANGVRPGVPMSAFAASGYGVPPTTPGAFMSPYTATTHSVVPPYAQQAPAQHLAQNSYVGQNASYFATPAVPGLIPHGGAQPSMFMQAGQASGEPHFIGTPPNLVRAQTTTSAPWLGSRPGAAPDVARDAGHMV